MDSNIKNSLLKLFPAVVVRNIESQLMQIYKQEHKKYWYDVCFQIEDKEYYLGDYRYSIYSQLLMTYNPRLVEELVFGPNGLPNVRQM